MRFSDMMGSGSEPPESSRPTEADGVIANALAPYLDAEGRTGASVGPATVEPVADVDVEPASSPAPAPAAATPTHAAPAPTVAPVVRSWVPDRPVPSKPEPVMAPPSPIVDFTPLSDDLLPHRR